MKKTFTTNITAYYIKRQGLTQTAPFGPAKMQYCSYGASWNIQIDTLSVVERAHHHTLWTRVLDFQTDYLDELVES
jgi:uncharacterized protein YcaQ